MVVLPNFAGDFDTERSGWPLSVSQWAGLMVPPMCARWHTVVLFGSGGKLYLSCEFNNYELALRVSIDLLLYVVTFVSLTILWRHCVAEMATESGRPVVDRPRVDFEVQLEVSWIAPEVYVTLDSDRIYELETTCVHDVLGLRAQWPGAAVVKVMTM